MPKLSFKIERQAPFVWPGIPVEFLYSQSLPYWGQVYDKAIISTVIGLVKRFFQNTAT